MFAAGDSFRNLEKAGQDSLFKNFYVKKFSKNFNKVMIFSYANEKVKGLPKNVLVIPNKYNLHRYLYGLLMPILNFKQINECDVFRVYHLFGTLPAVISKIFFRKKYTFNYAYDYIKFAQIEEKPLQVYLLKIINFLAKHTASKIFVANKTLEANIKVKNKVFLPNGVDTNTFKKSKTTKNKITKILSVGRLEKQKNYQMLIDALEGLNVKLVIVGSGSLKRDLENQSKLRQVSLTIIDKIPHARINNIYQLADIFVLPSLIEGSPKALFEAMASEKAVLGSDVEGMNDIINNGQNGILVKQNVKSLKLGLTRLLKSRSLRQKLAKNARKYILENYDLSTLIKKEILELKSIYE